MARGGKREGSGRRTLADDEETKALSVKVTESEAAFIKEAAARLGYKSQGRFLVDAAREKVERHG